MSVCERCGGGFNCGMADGGESGAPCWCMQLPPLPAAAAAATGTNGTRCMCPACLRQALQAALETAPADRLTDKDEARCPRTAR